MRRKEGKERLYVANRIGKVSECPVCSNGITGGSVYFSFGAVIDAFVMEEKNLNDSEIEGFCHFGYHGVDSEMSDSSDYCVAENVEGGQLDIYFCSLDCLRKWFCSIVDYLEQESGPGDHEVLASP